MQCPSCGNDVPARPTCQQCGAALFGSATTTLPASAQAAIPVPLTVTQKARLLVGCLPLLTMVLLATGYLALARQAIVPAPTLPSFLFMGVAVLVTGYQAIQNMRDLVSGVAWAQEDLLNQVGRSNRRGKARFYGRFARLGWLPLPPQCYAQSQAGRRYRVVYSPASKIVWVLEPPDPRIRH